MRQGSAETGLVTVALRQRPPCSGSPKTPLVGGFHTAPASPGPHSHVLSWGGGLLAPVSLPVMLGVTLLWGRQDTTPVVRRDGVTGNRGHPCRAPSRDGHQYQPHPRPPSPVSPLPLPGAVLWAPCGVCLGPRRRAGAWDAAWGPRGNGSAAARSCSVSQVETCQGCHVINAR